MRRWVWFIPITPPIVVPATAVSRVNFGRALEMYENDRRISGAIFCHVDRSRQFIHDREVITDGNHRWHGAAPNFNRSEIVKIIMAALLFIKTLMIVDDPIRRSMDPSACDRKYLIAASVS